MRKLLLLALAIVIFAGLGMQCSKPLTDSIMVQKDGKLIMINETGAELKTLKIDRKVFDFLWINPDLLVYTSLNGRNMLVFKYDMQKDIPEKIAELSPQNSNPDYWVSDFWHSIVHSGGKIYIDCDFREDFPYGFFRKSVYQIDLNSKRTNLFDSNNDSQQLQALITIDSSKFKYNSTQDSLVKKLRIGSDCELYYSNADSSKRISNTPFKKDTEMGSCIYFDVNPKGTKVLFSPSVGCGDFCHGPVYLVNLNGTDQQIIADDRAYSEIVVSRSTGLTYVIEGEYDGREFKNLRIKSVLETNTPKLLLSNIQKASICETNEWQFGYKNPGY
ncbi:MAG: hypothetical protein AMXMBFR49_04810 [Chlorobiota bacterium]